EAPLVVLARGEREGIGIARLELREGEPFPAAERQLREPRIGAVAARLEAEHGAHPLHGLECPAERARHIVEAGGVTSAAREQIAQPLAAMGRRGATERIQRDIVLALQPALGVPIGLAVPDEIENWLRHAPRDQSLTAVMSGASGCFMPTI